MIFMHQRSGCKKYAESLRFILIVFILMIAEASRSGSGNYNSRRGVTRRTISNSSRASPNPERIQSEIDSDPWVIVYPQTLPEQQLQQRTIGYGYGEPTPVDAGSSEAHGARTGGTVSRFETAAAVAMFPAYLASHAARGVLHSLTGFPGQQHQSAVLQQQQQHYSNNSQSMQRWPPQSYTGTEIGHHNQNQQSVIASGSAAGIHNEPSMSVSGENEGSRSRKTSIGSRSFNAKMREKSSRKCGRCGKMFGIMWNACPNCHPQR